MNYYPILIPFAPLVAAIYSAFQSRRGGEGNYGVGVFAHVIAVVVSLVTLGQVASDPAATLLVLCETPWEFLPTIALSIDRLSAVMMVLIASVGLVMYRYSIRYLQSEHGQSRYQALLALTVSTLLVMVSSRDLVLLFLAWQLLSWLLCHLAYNYAHLPTARSAFRTFIILRVGDVAFLAGIVLAYQLWGTVEFSELFERAAQNPVVLQPIAGIELSGVTAVTLLIFVGAMSQAAQFPLHMWLPESLFAPTPTTGLLHAGIINAGGFLLTRLAPLYVLSPPVLHVVFVIGLVTAVLGTSMMLVQNDIKKALGYSTIGQMGYMIMECGVGAFSLAIFHLIAHGLFKATMFLNCGHVIHETRHEPMRPETQGGGPALSVGSWVGGFVLSLALPFLIVYAAHELLHVPLRDSQGLVIFLFFSWVTASQAMLTLYRLRGAGAFKPQGVLLLAVTGVTLIYLFAAEVFTAFLYPVPETLTAYYQAASLPGGVFMSILVGAVGLIVVGWAGAYTKRQGRAVNHPQVITSLQTALYLLFMNRLYLDTVSLRVRLVAKKTMEALDASRAFLAIASLAGIVIASQGLVSVLALPPGNLAGLLVSILLVPLFPFHGAYTWGLTRFPGGAAIALAGLMPLVGVYGMTALVPTLPSSALTGMAFLALLGAIYASIKAAVQTHVPQLVAYTSLALYSILWWHVASVGTVAPDAIVYASAVVLVTVGMMLAWNRVQVRYGNLGVRQLPGLARPMPKFGFCLALLVMAAVGLPPFGLFFGYLGMLLASSTMSVGHVIVLFTWFGVSWYLFKLLQRLLFGPHRSDLRYDDLRPAEVLALAVILVLLVSLSVAPQDWFGAGVTEVARTVVEGRGV